MKSMSMDQFDVIGIGTEQKYEDYVAGKFQISIAAFKFERRVGFYLLQLYIPTAMLVCLSWAMFFLDHSHSGDRIAIGVTLFLTMIFLHGYANTSLPKVSYIKSLDIYMVVSLTQILLTIFESVIVTRMYVIRERSQLKESRKGNQQPTTKQCSGKQDHVNLALGKTCRLKLHVCPCLYAAADDDDDADIEKTKTVGELTKLKSDDEENHLDDIKFTEKTDRADKHALEGRRNKRALHQITERCCSIILPLSYVVFNCWYFFQFAKDRHQHGHNQ